MTTEEIIQSVKENPHTKIKLAVVDIDGILRGKYMHKDKFLSAMESGFGFCDVVFGWDANDLSYENSKVTGWHTGYPDAEARIDPQTMRTIPWEDGVPFFLADFSNNEGEDFPSCPRSLLKRVASRAENMGYVPVFAQEFEWFNFKETPESLYEKGFKNLSPLTHGMFGYSHLKSSEQSNFYHDLFEMLEEFEVPLEGLHEETGPGVYEAAVKYDLIMEAADRAVLFKSGVKEIGFLHGIIASFMAKQNMEMPGCSGHVHQSIWNADRSQNLFWDESGRSNMSNLMESYLAGQLHCLPHILPMYAPNINSFKRLVEGAWAPTTLTWAVDNRTVALRALPTGKNSCRLETRVVGSDTNPYLAMAACLASGLYGIEKGLKLDTPATVGNGYRDLANGVLPGTLIEASNFMKQSEIANELFGEAFVDHFTRTREWEWKRFLNYVTDWETKRYFEII